MDLPFTNSFNSFGDSNETLLSTIYNDLNDLPNLIFKNEYPIIRKANVINIFSNKNKPQRFTAKVKPSKPCTVSQVVESPISWELNINVV